MWEKEKEKVISLIYLWCNEGMLNASEHAAMVILSGKMKCLHSRLSERARERKRERRKIRGRERRVAILQKGVNHLISTAPPHSPQNGYFARSDGRHQEGGPSEPPHLISHLRSLFFNLSDFSYLWTGFIQHSAEFFFSPPANFYIKWNLLNYSFLKAQFNVLLNGKITFNFRLQFVYECREKFQGADLVYALSWTIKLSEQQQRTKRSTAC